ncbi:iron-sulfur cluster repair di-iron protein [Alloiococcus sp. CFN-8]|uniref:iron-sulfur cluster repair di-iron protein n=1 Tax=Alloiococcus sp. CFN-8 TaxID=3416081 RepID=UPI003CF40834
MSEVLVDKRELLLGESLGSIVAGVRGADRIFEEFKLDFCCGGDISLGAAIEEKDLGEEEIVERLMKLLEENSTAAVMVDWRKEDPLKLIDYILEVHHTFDREELTTIQRLLDKVLRAHYKKHPELLGKINKLFYSLKMELDEHFLKEEQVLFPMLAEYFSLDVKDEVKLKEIEAYINETEEEHDGAGSILEEIDEVTEGYTVPEGGCRTFELLYSHIRELTMDIHKHIHLENSVLFKML